MYTQGLAIGDHPRCNEHHAGASWCRWTNSGGFRPPGRRRPSAASEQPMTQAGNLILPITRPRAVDETNSQACTHAPNRDVAERPPRPRPLPRPRPAFLRRKNTHAHPSHRTNGTHPLPPPRAQEEKPAYGRTDQKSTHHRERTMWSLFGMYHSPYARSISPSKLSARTAETKPNKKTHTTGWPKKQKVLRIPPCIIRYP